MEFSGNLHHPMPFSQLRCLFSFGQVFQVSTGRYGSKQINFPISVAAKCIKLQVESQSVTTKNVGMRWELLGCTPGETGHFFSTISPTISQLSSPTTLLLTP